MDKVWAKYGILADGAMKFPSQGDYITHEIGREFILMVRQEDNSIKAFHNVCPHRGNRLVHNDNGSSLASHAHIMVGNLTMRVFLFMLRMQKIFLKEIHVEKLT